MKYGILLKNYYFGWRSKLTQHITFFHKQVHLNRKKILPVYLQFNDLELTQKTPRFFLHHPNHKVTLARFSRVGQRSRSLVQQMILVTKTKHETKVKDTHLLPTAGGWSSVHAAPRTTATTSVWITQKTDIACVIRAWSRTRVACLPARPGLAWAEPIRATSARQGRSITSRQLFLAWLAASILLYSHFLPLLRDG